MRKYGQWQGISYYIGLKNINNDTLFTECIKQAGMKGNS
jgi:hypothetical protein